MRHAFRFIRAWLAIIIITGFYGLLATLMLMVGFSGRFCHRVCGQRWGKWILRCSNVELKIQGLEKVDLNAPYVYMYNHMSYFLFFAIAAAFPCQWRGILRKEFLYIPFCWVFYRAGHIFLNLRNPQGSIRELEKAAGQIRDGISVFISPEGRRSGPDKLAHFKSGGFILAVQAGIPIVPITFLEDQQRTRPPLHRTPHVIRLIIHEPISTSGFTLADKEYLKGQVKERIQAGFNAEVLN